jgi:AcrR family transcriptional regulator
MVTQAERRATTRGALMQATIECLVELGYAGTTTNEVQQRAGVSRGALTHHFASKADLLLAAMDYLYDDFSASIRDAAATLPPGEERILPAIQMLWDRFHGPLFIAAMELWGAARTDPDLRAALWPHERRLGRQLRELAVEVFGKDVAAHPCAEAVYYVLMTSMRGQAMTYALQPGASRDGSHLQHWFDMVQAFARV